jgi:hypothetical protein
MCWSIRIGGAFELISVRDSDLCVYMACDQLGTLKARLLHQPDLVAECLNLEAFVGEPVSPFVSSLRPSKVVCNEPSLDAS